MMHVGLLVVSVSVFLDRSGTNEEKQRGDVN